MSTSAARNISAFAPHWSADELAAAMPRALPLHMLDLRPAANDARAHRPRRAARQYAATPALALFRIHG
ncbi:MAG: hypothetical protein IT473_04285 [Lysobacter sp.]|nr:hypothetical protein [Lysobacter sp.]